MRPTRSRVQVGGVAGVNHRAAEPTLERKCRPLAPIGPGEAVITGSGRLANRYIIPTLHRQFAYE